MESRAKSRHLASANLLSRRDVLRYLLLGGMGVASAACAAPPPAQAPTAAPKTAGQPTAGAAGAAQPATAAAPRKGGTFTLMEGMDILGFESTALGGANRATLYQLYDSLLPVGQKKRPGLAESWKFSDDGLSLTFNLRKGAKFHTGREIVADDVKFTYERYKDAAVGANLRPNLLVIADIATPDPYTALFKFSRRSPGILDVMRQTFIVNKDVIDKIKSAPAGSGPFTLDEWRPGEIVRMKRNENYWNKDGVLLDQFVIRIVTDNEARLAMLQRGEADGFDIIPGVLAQRIEGAQGIEFIRTGVSSGPYVQFNVTHKPFDNKKVRQAMGYAIDNERIAKTVFPIEGTAATGPFPPGHWARDEKLAATAVYDMNKAKALLAEAGFANGFKTTANVSTPDFSPGSKDTAQIIQEDWKKLGVEMEIKVYEAADARKRLFDSDFDILLHLAGGLELDPTRNFPGLTLGGGTEKEKPFSQFYSEEFSKVVSAAASEMDQAKRTELYHDVARIFLDEAFCHINVYRSNTAALRTKVHDYDWDISGFPVLQRTWVDS